MIEESDIVEEHRIEPTLEVHDNRLLVTTTLSLPKHVEYDEKKVRRTCHMMIHSRSII